MKHNTLFIIFIVSMISCTMFAFAHRLGYTLPDWVALLALVATCVNYCLFGYMIFLPKSNSTESQY